MNGMKSKMQQNGETRFSAFAHEVQVHKPQWQSFFLDDKWTAQTLHKAFQNKSFWQSDKTGTLKSLTYE